jgi:probable addiction module antidote protein
MEPRKQEEQAFLTLAGKLNEALESNDTKQFLTMLAQTLRERGGYTAAARAVGLNRTALYHTVSPDGNPRANTLSSLLAYFGLRLSVQPLDEVGREAAKALKKKMHSSGPRPRDLPVKQPMQLRARGQSDRGQG